MLKKLTNNDLKIALFCGGAGTRMWPLGRADKPKQFQPLLAGKSTFEITIERLLKGILPENIFPVVNREYVGFVAQQSPSIPLENIIIEPELRDTFAAVGLTATILHAKFGNVPVAGLWSDHLVKNEKAFLASLQAAAKLAQDENKMVEVGVRPTFASTQLGYIQLGKMIKTIDGMAVFEFLQQIEKPAEVEAAGFVKSWKYLWHVGIAVWETKLMLGFYKKLHPQVADVLEKIAKTKNESQISKLYGEIPKSSVDFAILEKLAKVDRLVISADLGWADVGAWDVLKDEIAKTAESLVTEGEVLDFDSKDCLIYETTDGKIVATSDLEGLVIVDTPDALLVLPKEKAVNVKQIVAKLKELKKEKFL